MSDKHTCFTIFTAFILLMLWSIEPVHAQKVGLVLSGGGAKGVTHIGVIKALEEKGIPIDYITGTSTGAIIGALYASGYTTDEMMDLITSGKFSRWMNSEMDVRYIYYFKQPDPTASWVEFKFDLDSIELPALLPSSIIKPVQLDFALMELFAGASAASRGNFDSLMIPFRCTAADIADNNPVILRKGSLPSAVRASMTFPFYLPPIRVDNKLLFDGGMYNNFPADAMASEFHPDVIIGSKAASNYNPPKDHDVVSQVQTMLMAKTDYSLHGIPGLIITPVLPGIALLDVSEANMIMQSGYDAAMLAMDSIELLIRKRVNMSDVSAKRNDYKKKIMPLVIDSINITGLNKSQKRYLQTSLRHKESTIPLEKIKPEFFKILADDKIESMYPGLDRDSADQYYTFSVDVDKEKKFSADIGGNLSSLAVNEAYFGLQYKYLGLQAFTLLANAYVGRFYTSAYAGARMDVQSNRPYFIRAAMVVNQWDYFKTSTFFIDDKTPSYLVINDWHIETDIGTPVGNKAKIQAGFDFARMRDDYYQSNVFSRTDTTDKTYFDFGSANVFYEKNTLNKKEYANKGEWVFVEAKYVLGNEEYVPGSTAVEGKEDFYSKYHHWWQFKLGYQQYFKPFKKFSLGLYAELVFSNQDLFLNSTASLLMAPSFNLIPETRTLFLPSYRANKYIATGPQLIYHLSGVFDIRTEAYVFQPFNELIPQENQTIKYGEFFATRYYAASGSLIYHAPIGPVSLSLNYFKNTDYQFSFVFNMGFIIFNSKALN
jgi:NTE family protein